MELIVFRTNEPISEGSGTEHDTAPCVVWPFISCCGVLITGVGFGSGTVLEKLKGITFVVAV
jgi:hypothetical protein